MRAILKSIYNEVVSVGSDIGTTTYLNCLKV